MNPIADDILMHYGVGKMEGAPGRGSGRFELGSGKNPNQHSGTFLTRVAGLKSEGLSEKEIANALGLTTTQLRTQMSLAKHEQRSALAAKARELRDKGYSPTAIAKEMGYAHESSIRSLLNEDAERRKNQAMKTAEFLKKQVDAKGMVDIGAGVELELGVSREKLKEAVYILEQEGYPTYGGRIDQVTNKGKMTTLKVLCPPGTEHKEIFDGEIHSVTDYISHDGGDTFDPSFVYPKSLNSKRVMIRYAEDGGIDKDGVMEIRRNVDDISLGSSHYAQVRILVDNDHYLKGMAFYSDEKFPDGVDIIFNTNKPKGTAKMDVLKKIKTDDPNNPFGALIKDGIVDPDDISTLGGGQSYYIDKHGKKQLSVVNKTREEGDWNQWSNKLPSQFLAKQSKHLINQQLNLTLADKQAELDDILELNNPTVKKILLASYANDCDAAAVHLKAAALPRQSYKVILPLTSIKDNEVYAPSYQDGETVALVRYPHGGTFEIPVLKVNNKQAEGKKVLGKTPADAIGINSKVAARLSGADFDGDTVMVIPCNSSKSKTKITSTHALKGLEGFDPKVEYGGKKEGTYKKMTKAATQTEMGIISNLITDMTLKGATEQELTRAVRHSMVVIDAEKHGLDYKQSEKDNNISALKKKYQGHYDSDGEYSKGASTLISRASAPTRVLKRQGGPRINNDGSLYFKEVVEEYTDKSGKKKVRTQKSTQMAETKDARTLSSGTEKEEAYATYANKMKSLANQARKEMISTGNLKYSPSAKQTYSEEVTALKSKLNVSLKNAPRERQAQIIANSTIKAMKQSNPDMESKEIKKASQRALTSARQKVGAKRTTIDITDKEWEAIQAGAITENILTKILNNTDLDAVRKRATPRAANELSVAKINRIKNLKELGYTTSEIAAALDVSTTVVTKYLSE